LPPSAVAVLREHRRKQLEMRLTLGLGKPVPTRSSFAAPTVRPLSPDNLSRDWIRTCKSLGLRKVMFHALRHTHVSALIAAGLDVVAISRRTHGSPNVTLGNLRPPVPQYRRGGRQCVRGHAEIRARG